MSRSPATQHAKQVLVRLDGSDAITRMWVKPWAARPGTAITYRGLGADWPWHPGVLIERQDNLYVIRVDRTVHQP